MSVYALAKRLRVPAHRINDIVVGKPGRDSPSPPALAKFGDDFRKRAGYCLLLAPSALAVTEKNYLINPQHADSRKILVGGVEPLTYDPRIFTPQRRRKHKLK